MGTPEQQVTGETVDSVADPTAPAPEGEPKGDAATATAAPSTDDLLTQILADQKAQRAEVASLREEVSRSRAPAPTGPAAPALSPEELRAQRLNEISAHSHYCPGCGRLYDYLRECVGRVDAPHPPMDVVPVTELTENDDPAQHTAAPNTDKLG